MTCCIETCIGHTLRSDMARGLILWTNVGHADGLNGDLVVLEPPFTIGEAEIARILETLGQVLCEMKNR